MLSKYEKIDSAYNLMASTEKKIRELEEKRKNTSYKDSSRKYIEEVLEYFKIEACLEKNNIKCLMYAYTCRVFCEVFNKYAGKQNGIKTNKKIKEELKEKTGFSIWFDNRTVYINLLSETGYTMGISTEIYVPYGKPLINTSNTIQGVEAVDLKTSLKRSFICEADMGKSIKEIYTAFKAYKAAEAKLMECDKAYNALTVEGINQSQAYSLNTLYFIV